MNHIGLASVLGTMILAGCAGGVPQPVEPHRAVSLTNAELANSELAPSPYTPGSTVFSTPDNDELHPSPFAADDEELLPSVRHPEPLPMAASASASSASVTRTWGASPAVEYGF